jgi:hypothetical protein
MTEYSTDMGIRGELRPNSGNDQLNWTLNFVRRMAGDIVDLKTHYWFFWRGWHSSSAADDQDLVYGDGVKTKAYHVFQKLFKTVRGGWKVKQVTDTDPDLRTDNAGLINSGSGDQWSAPVDLLAFEKPDGTQTCLMLVNNYGAPRSITGVSGLKGTLANVYVTSPTQDMAAQANRGVSGGALQGGALTLPAYSVTVVVTSGSVPPATRKLAVSGSTTNAVGYNSGLVANSHNGVINNYGSFNCFVLDTGESATYSLGGAKTVQYLDLAQAFSGSKSLKVEAQVGGVWQTVAASVSATGTRAPTRAWTSPTCRTRPPSASPACRTGCTSTRSPSSATRTGA